MNERNPILVGFTDTEIRMAFHMPWSTTARETLAKELLARGIELPPRGDRRAR